jgi:hypothetical protein
MDLGVLAEAFGKMAGARKPAVAYHAALEPVKLLIFKGY